ncbi:MAG: hypothetical protein VX498_06300 [Myxococcota bacterium]|nr:hypothetical protein [Myxococcota bacterium]
MSSASPSSPLERFSRSRWVQKLFAFRFLALLVAIVAVSGLVLHELEPFEGLNWGLTEWLHVVVGWVAVPWTFGYLVHHMVKRWGSFGDLFRVLGLVLAVALLLALLTGLLLDLPSARAAESWALPLHYLLTWPIVVLFFLHPSRIALRRAQAWLRGLRRPLADREGS